MVIGHALRHPSAGPVVQTASYVEDPGLLWVHHREVLPCTSFARILPEEALVLREFAHHFDGTTGRLAPLRCDLHEWADREERRAPISTGLPNEMGGGSRLAEAQAVLVQEGVVSLPVAVGVLYLSNEAHRNCVLLPWLRRIGVRALPPDESRIGGGEGIDRAKRTFRIVLGRNVGYPGVAVRAVVRVCGKDRALDSSTPTKSHGGAAVVVNVTCVVASCHG
mmetsp:Transcript_14917/g.32756  ORF Transcript_14917/g.32756 Transcript_14917/m.32756 type:complete len:222 (+) Transcript_14917:1355-2020(+)